MGRGEELPSVEINLRRRRSKNKKKNAEDEMRAHVLEYVTVAGKMPEEVYVELMDHLIPKWDDARRATWGGGEEEVL